MVETPLNVAEEQLERWALDFDSWDIVDGICGTLIGKTGFVFQKAAEWSSRPEEFVKRAGFVLMVQRAVHDKKALDDVFVPFLDAIEREAWDERRFVWKAVNWALRQIGKRNLALNKLAIETGMRVHAQGTKSARWIASDALRELRSEAVQKRLLARKNVGFER
jgi:3-methyladenine DNA glycosylase AlkD